MTTEDDRTRIDIRLPLSLDVVGVIGQMIGAAWPEAVIEPGTGYFTMLIPRRKPKTVPKRRMREILAETLPADDDPTAELAAVEADGLRIGIDSADEAWQELAAWAWTVLSVRQAPNYVEQPVTVELPNGTPATLIVTACWSKDQTPAQLHEQAVAERDAALRERDEARRERDEALARLDAGERR